MNDEAPDRDPVVDDLVRRATSDRVALGALYDRYYAGVLRYCWRRLLDRAAAEDVTSEVFLSVAEHIRQFEGNTESDFRRWLFRIATNAVNAQLRQSLRRQEIWRAAAEGGALGTAAVTNTTDAMLDWSAVQRRLLELDPREQSIVSLRFFAGLTHEEIAGVLDSTPGAIRTALSRTLARLRTQLNESEPKRSQR